MIFPLLFRVFSNYMIFPCIELFFSNFSGFPWFQSLWEPWSFIINCIRTECQTHDACWKGENYDDPNKSWEWKHAQNLEEISNKHWQRKRWHYGSHYVGHLGNCTSRYKTSLNLTKILMKVKQVFFFFIWFLTSHQQFFSYKGTGLPGFNQY